MATKHVQRVKKPRNLAIKTAQEMREYARSYTKTAIDALVEVIETTTAEKYRISAANSILDRGWGRPTQSIVFDNPNDSEILELVSEAQETTSVMNKPLQIHAVVTEVAEFVEEDEPEAEPVKQLTNGHLKE